jgi:uncharacterized protein YggE
MQKHQTLRKFALPILALAGLGVLAGCSALPSGDPSANANTLSVSGVGQASAAPDIAYVDLGVTTSGPDVGPAVEQTNQAARRVMQAILEVGVDEADVQTTNFNVWSEDRSGALPVSPEGDAPAAQTTTIYHAENDLHVTVRDVDQLGDVIQAGLDAGANQVRGVNFGIEETTAVQAEARAQAVEDARQRAEDLADEMGVSLGDPIVISEGTGGAGPYPVLEAAATGLGGGGPSISPGQLTVQVQVYVTYQLK